MSTVSCTVVLRSIHGALLRFVPWDREVEPPVRTLGRKRRIHAASGGARSSGFDGGSGSGRCLLGRLKEGWAADRVEQGPQVDHPVEGGGGACATAFVLAGGVVVGAVGVGVLFPVLNHPVGVSEAQQFALADEHLFVRLEQRLPVAGVGAGEQVDVLRRQRAP
ncbi:MAG: hypothetical protein ACRDZ2_00645 [Ilumatobacteraceae bacterium]